MSKALDEFVFQRTLNRMNSEYKSLLGKYQEAREAPYHERAHELENLVRFSDAWHDRISRPLDNAIFRETKEDEFAAIDSLTYSQSWQRIPERYKLVKLREFFRSQGVEDVNAWSLATIELLKSKRIRQKDVTYDQNEMRIRKIVGLPKELPEKETPDSARSDADASASDSDA
jgi:hypothetical protein